MAGGSKGGGRKRAWVALLRGINLGARNKVSMAALKELFADLGAEDVETYVQSGNVLFRSSGARDDLVRAVEDEIEKRLGLRVTVLLRTDAELAKLVADNPFAEDERDPVKLHVTFLAERPDRARAAALDEEQFAPDRFRVAGDVVYLHTPDGYGRSKLSNAYFEKQLGVRATSRNWRTVTTLAERAGATSG
jgi:uncharacterized protein (DUF1697 family)